MSLHIMAEIFNNDAFISHSAKDKPAVRKLARRPRVWLNSATVAYNPGVVSKEVN